MRNAIAVLIIASLPGATSQANVPANNRVFLGDRWVTAYQSRPEQTDSSPLYTSIGLRTSTNTLAVSQDWLREHELKYGDRVMVEGIGVRTVQDVMNRRHKRRMDVWVRCTIEEHMIGVKRRRVWLMK
jgi:3D (Asp-Asp-Asp) domain-containing protein